MIDARLQILYLVAVGVLAFVTSHPGWLLGLLALQFVVWAAARLPIAGLARILRRLAVFILFIVVSFAFFGAEGGDRLFPLALGVFTVPLNLSGIVRGLLLSTRIVTVICAAQILQQAGNRTTIVRGLRGLFVPAGLAYSLDLVLTLLGTDEPRHGRGAGRRRAREGGAENARLRDVLRQLVRGDVGFLVDSMQRNIARAQERAKGYGLKPEAVSDLAVIAGLGVLSMTLRAVKVLPGVPFAPGHKGIVVLPLYIVAHDLTVSRWGATRLGIVIGMTSFLMGEGKFGPFEIFRHITPGVFVDLVMPLVRALSRTPGAFLYALVGAGAAVTRVSTLLVVAYFVDAPGAFYAFLLPMAISNTVFGFLSGFVTFHLMSSLHKLRAVL